jgi:SAM-dependent methyltransferase
MSTQILAHPDPYVLATGQAAVRRLHVLHNVYSPGGKRALLQAGLKPTMNVADFGCGVGVVTRMLAHMVGRAGRVTGIDIDRNQLQEAADLCASDNLRNTFFIQARAERTGLPENSFDLVYCRFLLLHMQDPVACLREMHAVLKPGGILVVEDGDLTTATSIPPSSMDAFADLFGRLGPTRGVNYSIARDLYPLAVRAGFTDVHLDINQPIITRGEDRYFLKWSVQEAGPALVNAGILTPTELTKILADMQAVVDDPEVVILPPRMSIVYARKPAANLAH